MNYEEFTQKTGGCANLSPEKARASVKAVLETLGERIGRTERHHLASQLPVEMKGFVERYEPATNFDLEGFYSLVGARAGITYSHAVNHTRAVMKVLAEAVSQGELDDIAAGLPPEFVELFKARAPGAASAGTLGTVQTKDLRKHGAQG